MVANLSKKNARGLSANDEDVKYLLCRGRFQLLYNEINEKYKRMRGRLV